MLKLEGVTHQFANGTKALQDVTLDFDSQAFTVSIVDFASERLHRSII